MRVIVTRPEPAGTKTAKRLAELGHTALSLPLFEARHEIPPLQIETVRASSALVVTSSEALRSLSALAPLMRDALCALPAFAVGEKTGAAARKFGISTVHVSGGNGEKLAAGIAARQEHLTAKPLLYLAGEPRSPGLEQGLASHGIPCRTLVCYRMHPVEYDASDLLQCLPAEAETTVLLYSTQAALRLMTLDQTILPGLLDRLSRFFCLSPAIASALPPQTRARQGIAADPSEQALLRLLGEAG